MRRLRPQSDSGRRCTTAVLFGALIAARAGCGPGGAAAQGVGGAAPRSAASAQEREIRARGAQQICAAERRRLQVRQEPETDVERKRNSLVGVLCNGGGAGGREQPCYFLTMDSWELFGPVLCRPRPGGGPAWMLALLRDLRNRRLVFYGDSITRQVGTAFRCALQQAGVPYVTTVAGYWMVAYHVRSWNFTFGMTWVADMQMLGRPLPDMLAKDRPDVVVFSLGQWYGQAQCVHPVNSSETVGRGDLEPGQCPFGWRRKAWEADVSLAIRTLLNWKRGRQERAFVFRETSASHWLQGGFTVRSLNSTFQTCVELQQRLAKLPEDAARDVGAHGGGAHFCRWPWDNQANLARTMEYQQSELLSTLRVYHGNITVQPWYHFSAPYRDMHPGAYWHNPYNNTHGHMTCDCNHWCYNTEFWDATFESMYHSIRHALGLPPRPVGVPRSAPQTDGLEVSARSRRWHMTTIGDDGVPRVTRYPR
eukprot:TRINITY_DN43457_c0_g1_i1.p1 TRINITY_DN43457_c0_g1~~TRINITY_DN43457_c0_g1_i1.p1  ORF type:complete len:479 (+),score=71.64 TRINITY_DN43457_c0_g1_i1:125-1561(+)